MLKSAFLTLFALGAVSASNAFAQSAFPGPAQGPTLPAASSPFSNHHPAILSIFHRGSQTLPVYQAAPWYLYWPYDAHFMTPAPMTGAYYAPPTGAYPIQPFFPQPNYYSYQPPYGVGAQQPAMMNPPQAPIVLPPNPGK